MLRLKLGESTNRGAGQGGTQRGVDTSMRAVSTNWSSGGGVYGLEYMIRDRTRLVLKKKSTCGAVALAVHASPCTRHEWT